MSNKLAFDEDARWLQSDGSIIGKVHRKPDPQGIRLTLDMPFGEPVVAVLAKLDAGSMTQFCEIARETYNERKSEQIAQAERASRRVEERRAAESEEIVQAHETSVVVNPLDPSSIRSRLVEIGRQVAALSAGLKTLDAEGNVLCKILEVLDDASKDDEETDDGLPGATVTSHEREVKSRAVDKPTCEAQLQQTGEGSAGQSDPGLELLPDTESKASEDRSFQKETDVNAGSVETDDSNTDTL